MAAKLLEHLKDERKQTGCLTCFIHLFDPRIHTLFKVIPSCGCEVEQTIHPHGLDMRSTRNSNDMLGMYTESSRASSSSSPSSSFSSLDYSKVMHTEPSSYDRIIFPESPLLDRSLSHSSSSWRMRQRSFDLNDAVEESALLKCQDSPRPLQPMKLSVGSLYALSEHKGSPLKFKDSLCLHNADEKSSTQLYKSKGTQERYQTKETQMNCGTMDELARLSTDSRECSLPNYELRTMQHNQRRPSVVEKLMGLEAMPGVSSSTLQNSNKFAKNGEGHDTNMMSASPANPFMPIQVSSAQRFARKDHAMHKWKNGEMVMKPLSSSRILVEPAPWKQPDVNRTLLKSAVKTKQGAACSSNGFAVAYSKFEERLKDVEFHRSSKDLKALKQMLDAVQKNGSWRAEKNVLINGMTINHNPDLDMTPKTAQRETNKSACISEADGEQESRGKSMKSPIVLMKPITLLAKSDIAASSVIRSEGSRHLSKPHGNDSTSRKKASSNTEMVKGQNARNSYQSPRNRPGEKKLAHTRPTMPHSLSKEKKTNSAISAGTASPRMHQQKKFEFEKKPRPATKSRNATKLSMPISKHPIKSCTSGGKSRSKYAFIQQCNAQSSGFSTESNDASYCEDDTEVTSKLRLDHIDGGHSPARTVIRPMFSGIRKHKPGRIPCEDSPLAHPATTAPEQPSPVSILDSTAYRDDDAAFPLKKTASCDTKTGISSSNHLLENAAGLVTSISREKLKQIEDLVLKLKGVSSTYHESSTDFIASHCKTTNPDQGYISKILLASGFLLRDFESTGYTFQPHISGHPINPELFFVLEQTKSGALLPTGDSSMISASKSHRRLIFDSCNEILAKLLVPPGMSDESQSVPRKLARKNITARRLLKDLCDRVEQLQDKSNQQGKVKQEEEAHDEDDGLNNILFEDMKLKSDKWENSENCIPEVVLDIERMLYKDLVKEIISDEGVLSFALRSKAGRSCDRKLCFNNI